MTPPSELDAGTTDVEMKAATTEERTAGRSDRQGYEGQARLRRDLEAGAMDSERCDHGREPWEGTR